MEMFNRIVIPDEQVSSHCKRTSLIAGNIALQMGHSKEQVTKIQEMAYLHDIGKLMIPKVILYKRESLTLEEWELMKKHSIFSEIILQDLGYDKNTCMIVRQHHERIDGSGYPDGIQGIKNISIESQIIAVSDVFDALTSDRIYRKVKHSSETAIDMMKYEKGLNQNIVSVLENIVVKLQFREQVI